MADADLDLHSKIIPPGILDAPSAKDGAAERESRETPRDVAPLKVAHAFKVFIPEVNGGIPEVMRLLAQGLAKRCRAEVLVSRVQGSGGSDIAEGIEVHRTSALRSVWSMPISPGYPLAFWLTARRVDVIDHHAPFPLVDLAVSLWFPKKTALIVHWHSEIVAQKRLLPLVGPFIRRTLRRADRIIVSTPAMIERSPFLKPFAGKCAVIPYGIDIDAWTRLTEGQRRRIKEIKALHPRLIVATGRLVPYKGFGVLIDAMRAVDGDLIIVGTGPLEGALRQRIAEAGLTDRVTLVGYLERPELQCLLHACDVFTLPSVEDSETFGIAQAEAMACGKSIVNTRLSTGVPWVARDGIEALTVTPGSAPELSHALGHLLDHPDAAAAMGRRGRERAEDLFGLKGFLDHTFDTYRRALEGRRHGEPR
ncbi:glycosyl transferase [Skermanella stibiiresistens SB22]|uniref:Glycosyl transferase n=1 Tax=Skermanella stibiiresistens SB22 TaxID=1385369 RepID=W9GYD6_9PROT|nr:glycosyltransferase [Skermanella stibiiresistens]EWY36493.1 glycosyl transferase [Skermanella stibiiresistens SB22]